MKYERLTTERLRVTFARQALGLRWWEQGNRIIFGERPHPLDPEQGSYKLADNLRRVADEIERPATQTERPFPTQFPTKSSTKKTS